MAARVRREPALELLAPVALNIVCFRVAEGSEDLNALNKELVADIQEAGIAAPSTTTIGGKLAIRAGVFNHRSTREDADALVDGILAMAKQRTKK
jgi:glutamate/tyrosine decarboxylase-like PLP-dependent enzyme